MTFDTFLARFGQFLAAALPFIKHTKTAAEVKIAIAVIEEVKKPNVD